MDDIYEADNRGVDRKPRKCTECGEYFASWGPGNRVCEPCRDNPSRKRRNTSDFPRYRDNPSVKPGVRSDDAKDQ